MSVNLCPTTSLEVSPYHSMQVTDRSVQSLTYITQDNLFPLGKKKQSPPTKKAFGKCCRSQLGLFGCSSVGLQSWFLIIRR